MKEHLLGLPYDYIGISDSSVPLYWDFYKTLGAKIIIVNRDEKEAFDSFVDFTNVHVDKGLAVFEKLKKGLTEIRKGDALELDFNALPDNKTVKKAWEYILPYAFDETRCQVLQGLVVQQDIKGVEKTSKIKKSRTGIGKISIGSIGTRQYRYG